jgi:hypothetical protein
MLSSREFIAAITGKNVVYRDMTPCGCIRPRCPSLSEALCSLIAWSYVPVHQASLSVLYTVVLCSGMWQPDNLSVRLTKTPLCVGEIRTPKTGSCFHNLSQRERNVQVIDHGAAQWRHRMSLLVFP